MLEKNHKRRMDFRVAAITGRSENYLSDIALMAAVQNLKEAQTSLDSGEKNTSVRDRETRSTDRCRSGEPPEFWQSWYRRG